MDVFATRAFPAADRAVAVGGSAASLRRVVGEVLDPRLAQARARDALRRPVAATSRARYALDAERVRLLPGRT